MLYLSYLQDPAFANISKTLYSETSCKAIGTVVLEGYRKVQERATLNVDLQRFTVGPDDSKIHFWSIILY